MVTATPEWLNAELFQQILENNVQNFEKIRNFQVQKAFATNGENYLSILWSIEIEVELKDGAVKALKYMLKAPPSSSSHAMALITMMNSFERERIAYYKLIPAFEEIYRKCGKTVDIAPKVYKLKEELGMDLILMDDLRQYGYKNMNRLEGLDMPHTLAVLKKLAEFHAASATYIAERGNLPQVYEKSMMSEQMLDMLVKIQKPLEQRVLENLKLYQAEQMREILTKYKPVYLEQLRESEKHKPDGFYIFSHGDSWLNNIMFQHDAKGNVINTRFVDFQMGRLTSPAMDLQYFLLSSTNLDNKIKYFDLFVQYYHEKLLENLEILNYPKRIPSLRDVHIWMYEHSFLGYTVVINYMPIFLLDHGTRDISLDNMLDGNTADGKDLHRDMYGSQRYAKHMQKMLPWMFNRGYFE